MSNLYTCFAAQHDGLPPENDVLTALEEFTRDLIVARLDLTIARLTPANNDSREATEPLHSLRQIRQALDHEGRDVIFSLEPALPLTASSPAGFSEGLVRIQRPGAKHMMPEQIFQALKHPLCSRGDASYFRLWLAFACLRHSYKDRPATEAISFNVFPEDIDSPGFRSILRDGLLALKKEGFDNLIVEAVENAPWTGERADFLLGLQKKGLRIALDDYAAPEGRHTPESLTLLSRDPANPLIVKLDGVIVKNFINKDDPALVDAIREIRHYAPSALIVAEWVEGVEAAGKLAARLTRFGLAGSIHIVQDRGFDGMTGPALKTGPDKKTGPAPGNF